LILVDGDRLSETPMFFQIIGCHLYNMRVVVDVSLISRGKSVVMEINTLVSLYR